MEILKQIKEAVLSVNPEAEIFLFGSRARGSHNPDSDWDILVLISDFNFFRQKNKILNAVLDVEMLNDLNVNVIVQKKNQWLNDELLHVTPFFQNVIKDYQIIQ